MELSFLAGLYDQRGPFASAYVDTERDVELAPHEINLRVRALRRELLQDGCDDESTLDALEDRVGSDRNIGKPQGQALFAADGTVRLIVELDRPPADASGRWAPLPHVMPMLARHHDEIPSVRVAADRAGAVITGRTADGEETQIRYTGEQWPLTKVSAGEYGAQTRYQRRAEATWDRNARSAAEQVASLAARVGAELIVVDGDVRAVALLREHLPAVWDERVVEVDTSGTAGPGYDERLEQEARQAVDRLAHDRRRRLIERFEEARGNGHTVEGFSATVNALAEGRVDVLMLRDHPESEATLWFGPDLRQAATRPEALTAQGVERPTRDRADAVLVRAATGNSCSLEVNDDLPRLRDDIGALLRF